MHDISLIIMASGLSKRMGINKLTMDFDGEKMYKYVIDAVKNSKVKQKIIVSAYDEILQYCEENTGFLCVKNDMPQLGQSQSIKLGVSSSDVCNGYMFLPCDMPFITADTIDEICRFFDEDKNCITVPRINGKNTMPTIFPNVLTDELLNIQGDIGGRDIIKKYIEKVRYIDIENDRLLMDIDTKEDIENYRK